MATIKSHVSFGQTSTFCHNSIFFHVSSSIYGNSRDVYVTKTFWLDFALISVIFLNFSNNSEISRWRIQDGGLNEVITCKNGIISKKETQGYLINVNLLRCVLTEQNQRGAVPSTPTPVSQWGDELARRVRGLIEDKLNPSLSLFSLEEIWYAKKD